MRPRSCARKRKDGAGAQQKMRRYMGVSKNSGTPKWMVCKLRPAAAGVAKLAARDAQLRVQMLLF